MIKFVGRDGDLNRVKEALRTNHCISVVGVGGVGKTRLVKELIRNEGNAIFVSLESVQSLVLSDLLNTTIQELKSKTKKELLKTILILDNAEHVITPLRDQIGQFLDLGCRVLITSREPLKHPEEFVLRLLPFDRAQTEVFFRTLLTQQNLALESELDSFNYQAIYAWLDGLPLALEIVAQKLSVLSYKEQNTFLEKQLFPQHPRSSEKAERHRTLNHAFEWSWASCQSTSLVTLFFIFLAFFSGRPSQYMRLRRFGGR